MEMNYEITFGGNKKVDARVRGFTIRTDQPVADGGEDSAPEKYKGAIIKAAESCAVKKHLSSPPAIRIHTRYARRILQG